MRLNTSAQPPACAAARRTVPHPPAATGKLDELTMEQKEVFVSSCPTRVYALTGPSVTAKQVEVSDHMKCIQCLECVRVGEAMKADPNEDNVVAISARPDNFLFTVEVRRAALLRLQRARVLRDRRTRRTSRQTAACVLRMRCSPASPFCDTSWPKLNASCARPPPLPTWAWLQPHTTWLEWGWRTCMRQRCLGDAGACVAATSGNMNWLHCTLRAARQRHGPAGAGS